MKSPCWHQVLNQRPKQSSQCPYRQAPHPWTQIPHERGGRAISCRPVTKSTNLPSNTIIYSTARIRLGKQSLIKSLLKGNNRLLSASIFSLKFQQIQLAEDISGRQKEHEGVETSIKIKNNFANLFLITIRTAAVQIFYILLLTSPGIRKAAVRFSLALMVQSSSNIFTYNGIRLCSIVTI